MKEKLIQLMMECDSSNYDVCNVPQFAPSSSIEEIAEYITKWIEKSAAR